MCAQPLVDFLTLKGIRIKNVEKTNASRASGLQEAELPSDEDDDDYGGEESETGIICFLMVTGSWPFFVYAPGQASLTTAMGNPYREF